MGWATTHIEMLQAGETVTFSPRGRSMEPIVKDGQPVIVAPVFVGSGVSKGDVVLCKVRGYEYLHLIVGYDKYHHRFQIGNNKGKINGWIEAEQIFGKAML